MEIQNIFYALGSTFLVAAITYFAWEYLLVLPKEIKTVILFCLVIIFFSAGRYLQERDI